MRILVCFKVVPDLDNVLVDEWNACTEGNIDLSYVKKIYNSFDEAALEMALRISEIAKEQGQDAEVTALTISSENIDSLLRNLYAVKMHRVVKIECDCDVRFNAWGIAQIIVSYVREAGMYDVILMGCQAAVGNNGQTALLTAEMLGYPCITQVMDSVPVGEHLRVVSQIDQGIRRQTIKPPAVLAVGNAVHPYLRIPTLKEKMGALKSEISYLSLPSLKLSPDQIERYNDKFLISLYRESQGRQCEYVEGASPEEKAQVLYDRYISSYLSSKEGKAE